MSLVLRLLLVIVLPAAFLWGCSRQPDYVSRDEPWRRVDEMACLRSGYVRESRYLHTRSALGGPSECGAVQPYEMLGTADGAVQFTPAATLRCPMIPAVDHWVRTVVQPAARAHLAATVVELKVAASYSCRPMNGVSGAKLSEHGHANALDVSAFRLADGRLITVKEGWSSWTREGRFLKAIHHGACSIFTTVLGPEANAYHRDHFHVDLARHGRDGARHVCE